MTAGVTSKLSAQECEYARSQISEINDGFMVVMARAGATLPMDAAHGSDAPFAYDDLALKKGKMKAFVDVDPDEYYEQQVAIALC